MRYDNDGVRVGVLSGRSRVRSQFHLETLQVRQRQQQHLQSWRRPVIGNDRSDDDAGPGGRGSLKVLLFDYVNELVWFFTRFNEFLFMFVFQLLYER